MRCLDGTPLPALHFPRAILYIADGLRRSQKSRSLELRDFQYNNISADLLIGQIAGALHISRNTDKKYWDGNSVPWERKDYSREATVITDDVISFVKGCLDEDAHCRSKKTAPYRKADL